MVLGVWEEGRKEEREEGEEGEEGEYENPFLPSSLSSFLPLFIPLSTP
jgi:hypothetical protein